MEKAKKHLKQTLIFLLKVSVSGAMIWWLINSGRLDFSKLAVLAEIHYLVPLFALVFLSLFLCSERWRMLMNSQGIAMRTLPTFKLALIGGFFNFVMPGGVGGDLIKGFYITQEFPTAKLKSGLTVLIDRVIGLFSMVVLAMFFMLINPELLEKSHELKLILLALFGVFAAFMVLTCMVFVPFFHNLKVIRWGLSLFKEDHPLQKIYHSFMDYRHSGKTVLISILFSLVAQFVSILFFVYAAQILGFFDIPASAILFVVPVAFIVQSLPISPAGIGIGQAALFYLFHIATGKDSAVGPATMTAFQIFNFLLGLLGAFFYLTMSKKPKA